MRSGLPIKQFKVCSIPAGVHVPEDIELRRGKWTFSNGDEKDIVIAIYENHDSAASFDRERNNDVWSDEKIIVQAIINDLVYSVNYQLAHGNAPENWQKLL